MNFGCVLLVLADAKIPDKGYLLPLASKILGYCIVAASTTVKLPQNKGTGELSFLTCFMNFAGSIVIMGSTIGIVMNGTLLSEILMYQKPAPKEEKKED